jgi:predicted nucleotidyltransferase
MARILAEITPEGIQAIVDQIVEQFHPEKVILFGSYAYGTPDDDSDVDLLVVMETGDENPLLTAARISATLIPLKRLFSIDILVWPPDKLMASFERGGNFATEVMTEGIVLYDARN